MTKWLVGVGFVIVLVAVLALNNEEHKDYAKVGKDILKKLQKPGNQIVIEKLGQAMDVAMKCKEITDEEERKLCVQDAFQALKAQMELARQASDEGRAQVEAERELGEGAGVPEGEGNEAPEETQEEHQEYEEHKEPKVAQENDISAEVFEEQETLRGGEKEDNAEVKSEKETEEAKSEL